MSSIEKTKGIPLESFKISKCGYTEKMYAHFYVNFYIHISVLISIHVDLYAFIEM